MKDATYLKFIILSPENHLVENRKYKIGDKFLLKEVDDSFSPEIASLLREKRVILEILGYALTNQGEVVNDTVSVMDDELTFRWLLTDKELEESFYYLGDDFQQARFVLIDV